MRLKFMTKLDSKAPQILRNTIEPGVISNVCMLLVVLV